MNESLVKDIAQEIARSLTWRGESSPLGAEWESISDFNTMGWAHVLFANDQFVSVARLGTGNRAMTSPDGVTWTQRATADDAAAWRHTVWAENLGLYVAVASAGTSQVMTSPDGVTWTARTSPSNSWFRVAYNGSDLFVALAVTGAANNAMTSPDGVTWTARTGTGAVVSGLTYGNGLFVAVNSSGSSIMTSPDGITWTARTNPAGTVLRDVIFTGEGFVALGDASDNILTSDDGITWTVASELPEPGNNWRSLGLGSGTYVAVAQTGDSRVAYSTDLETWTSVVVPDNTWDSVAFGASRFVAVAAVTAGDKIMVSPPP